MPIEIRELVIRAQVQDNTGMAGPVVQAQKNGPSATENSISIETDAEQVSPELMDRIVAQCMAKMQEWLTEKSMR